MEQTASFELIILVFSEKFLACWGIPKSILYIKPGHWHWGRNAGWGCL